MEFRILGSLEAVGDGGPVGLGGWQQRALLAVLLVERGRVVSTEQLIDEIWPDDPPATGVRTIRVYVSQLRKLVGDGTIQTRERGYLLQTPGDSIDANRFERLLGESRRVAAQGDRPGAIGLLRQGLGLWRGPLLPEFAALETVRAMAARFEGLRLDAFEELFALSLAEGEAASVTSDLEAICQDHPLRERLWAHLMLALYRAGRQAEALAAYQRARRHLDGLGIEPSEELKRLQLQILQHDPALDLDPEPPREGILAAVIEGRAMPKSRVVMVALMVTALLLASVAVFALSRGGSTIASSGPITLVLAAAPPSASATAADDTNSIGWAEQTGLGRAAATYGVPVRYAYGSYLKNQIRAARQSSVVILGPIFPLGPVAAITRRFPQVLFVLPGGSIHDARFGTNVVGMPFDDHEVGLLGGYVSGLMAGRSGRVSAVAGAPTPEVRRIVAAYLSGVHATAPSIRAAVGYSGTFIAPGRCELLANRQIDHGSTVIFDIAGNCGFGAINAAGVRGAAAVGIDSDLSSLGPQVIGSVEKNFTAAVDLAVHLYTQHRLSPGRDVTLDLTNQGVNLVITSPTVSSAIRARLESLVSTLRAHDRSRNG